MNSHFRVITAIIEHGRRYLITPRSLAGTLAGLWEFPGCRVERGESDEKTLKRELHERLGVDVEIGRMKAQRTQHYVGYSVDLILYETSIPSNQTPQALRVADFRWVAPQDFDHYPFPPADQATSALVLGIKEAPSAKDNGSKTEPRIS